MSSIAGSLYSHGSASGAISPSIFAAAFDIGLAGEIIDTGGFASGGGNIGNSQNDSQLSVGITASTSPTQTNLTPNPGESFYWVYQYGGASGYTDYILGAIAADGPYSAGTSGPSLPVTGNTWLATISGNGGGEVGANTIYTCNGNTLTLANQNFQSAGVVGTIAGAFGGGATTVTLTGVEGDFQPGWLAWMILDDGSPAAAVINSYDAGILVIQTPLPSSISAGLVLGFEGLSILSAGRNYGAGLMLYDVSAVPLAPETLTIDSIIAPPGSPIVVSGTNTGLAEPMLMVKVDSGAWAPLGNFSNNNGVWTGTGPIALRGRHAVQVMSGWVPGSGLWPLQPTRSPKRAYGPGPPGRALFV